jgi:hypothetical protein
MQYETTEPRRLTRHLTKCLPTGDSCERCKYWREVANNGPARLGECLARATCQGYPLTSPEAECDLFTTKRLELVK